ncbi:hypothetical protein [Mycolicibacter kumamotonensis]|uniref:hypothetical protein n=1 Tax=Mycolicibacter kumamotonensis TaxID=354243 RepID=UPI0010428014|nr:hypothetical protein [Mycolicibacter kumamotonensis]
MTQPWLNDAWPVRKESLGWWGRAVPADPFDSAAGSEVTTPSSHYIDVNYTHTTTAESSTLLIYIMALNASQLSGSLQFWCNTGVRRWWQPYAPSAPSLGGMAVYEITGVPPGDHAIIGEASSTESSDTISEVHVASVAYAAIGSSLHLHAYYWNTNSSDDISFINSSGLQAPNLVAGCLYSGASISTPITSTSTSIKTRYSTNGMTLWDGVGVGAQLTCTAQQAASARWLSMASGVYL